MPCMVAWPPYLAGGHPCLAGGLPCSAGGWFWRTVNERGEEGGDEDARDLERGHGGEEEDAEALDEHRARVEREQHRQPVCKEEVGGGEVHCRDLGGGEALSRVGFEATEPSASDPEVRLGWHAMQDGRATHVGAVVAARFRILSVVTRMKASANAACRSSGLCHEWDPKPLSQGRADLSAAGWRRMGSCDSQVCAAATAWVLIRLLLPAPKRDNVHA